MYWSLYKQIVGTLGWFPTLRLRRCYTRQNCSLDATSILTELQNDAWQPHTPHQVFNANYVSCMAVCVCCTSASVGFVCTSRWTALDKGCAMTENSSTASHSLSTSHTHIHTQARMRPLEFIWLSPTIAEGSEPFCGAVHCGNVKKHRTMSERRRGRNCMKVASNL